LVLGSVAANICYGAKANLTAHDLNHLLSDLELNAYAAGKDNAVKQVAFETTAVSGGENYRIAIARELTCGTETILLDEPTSARIPPLRKDLDVLKRRARPLILITHRSSVIARPIALFTSTATVRSAWLSEAN